MSRLRVRQSSRGFYYFWTSFLRDWRSVLPEEVWIGPFESVTGACEAATEMHTDYMHRRPAPVPLGIDITVGF